MTPRPAVTEFRDPESGRIHPLPHIQYMANTGHGPGWMLFFIDETGRLEDAIIGVGLKRSEAAQVIEEAEHYLTNRAHDHKVQENRVRRMADRQGLRLVKSRSRDTQALTYGTYGLLNPSLSNVWVLMRDQQNGYGCDLDEIEEWLSRPAPVASQDRTGRSTRSAS